MIYSRVVTPETTTLSISNGDTLLVKKRLNTGEARQQYDRMYRESSAGRVVDPLQVGLARILAYLLDWSLVYPDGTKIQIAGKSEDEVIAALNSLDYDSFTEIRDAITVHEQAMADERAALKKTQSIEPASSLISPSLVGATGGTNG